MNLEFKFEIILSKYENELLLYKNYLFEKIRKQPNKDGSISWRCINCRPGSRCNSTCRTQAYKFVNVPSQHNNEPINEYEIAYKRATATTKKRAREDLEVKVPKIYRDEMDKAVKAVSISTGQKILIDTPRPPKYNGRRKFLQKQRKQQILPEPKTTDEIQLTREYQITNDQQRFQMFDTNDADRIISFGSDNQILNWEFVFAVFFNGSKSVYLSEIKRFICLHRTTFYCFGIVARNSNTYWHGHFQYVLQ